MVTRRIRRQAVALDDRADSLENLMTVAEAAKLLKVSRQRVHQYINEGHLPYRRLGPILMVERAAVAILIVRRRTRRGQK